MAASLSASEVLNAHPAQHRDSCRHAPHTHRHTHARAHIYVCVGGVFILKILPTMPHRDFNKWVGNTDWVSSLVVLVHGRRLDVHSNLMTSYRVFSTGFPRTYEYIPTANLTMTHTMTYAMIHTRTYEYRSPTVVEVWVARAAGPTLPSDHSRRETDLLGNIRTICRQ